MITKIARKTIEEEGFSDEDFIFKIKREGFHLEQWILAFVNIVAILKLMKNQLIKFERPISQY